MHKIFARQPFSDFWPASLPPLYASRASEIGEDAARRFVISVFSLPTSRARYDETFPHAQFADDNAPCHGIRLQRSSHARGVASLIVPLFLNAELSPSALTHSTVP